MTKEQDAIDYMLSRALDRLAQAMRIVETDSHLFCLLENAYDDVFDALDTDAGRRGLQ